ncbi:PAS domain S-box protein [Natronomonas sp.]|uniref:PAS domain S-box protein n=1 Tax=Natronomonas sp. TaxID=2184060 RepID=UPI002FC3688F
MSTGTDRITVLHVDDDPDFAELAGTFLEREDDRIEVETATKPETGLEFLAANEVDCIVSDYDMPGTNGIEFLEAVRAEYPDLPFILYTGKGSEEVASDAISAGVTDYLQKQTTSSQYTVLANRVLNAVDQYRSKYALEASRERLSLFFEESPLGVIEWNDEFDIVRVNEAATDILGYDEGELHGRSWEAIVAESDLSETAAVVEALLENGGGYHAVTENARKDGEHVLCEWHNWVVTNDADEIIAIFSQFQDVMEQRTQQQELERYRAVVQAATNTIIMVDEDGRIESVNPAVEDTFGYTPEELVSEPVTTLMSADVAERHTAAFERYLDTGERTLEWEYTELEGRHRDGSSIPLSVTFGEVTYEGERLFVGIIRDITERKVRERELQRKERRYQAVFNDPNIRVGLLDTDGTVQDVNETALGYIEQSFEEFRDQPFWTTPWFAHSEAVQTKVRDWIGRAAAGEYVEYEVDLEHPNGDPYTVEGVFRPVTSDEGEVVSVLVSDRDITEQKEHERELEWTNAVLSSLLETLPVAVLAEDDDREVLAANQRLFDLFEMDGTPDDFIGANCEHVAEQVSDMFADPDAFVERINELVDERVATTDEELTLRDGRTFTRSHVPVELPDRSGHLWMYRDVTEQKEYEQRLEALSERAQSLIGAESRERVAEIGVEAARDILGLDANAIHLANDERDVLKPVAMTEAISEWVGDPPTFTPGSAIAWRAYDEGNALAIDDVHDDSDVYNPETQIRSELHLPLDDHGILIAGSLTPNAFDEEDIALGKILAGSITTALEQIERTERLRDRERELTRQNDRLEEFASIVSHDLRNPLSVASGRLELAQEDCDTTHLDPAEQALDRMDSLIDDLLTLARQGDVVGDLESVPLETVTRQCWENVSTGDATLRIESDRVVEANRGRLQQLLENLFRNAVEHGSTSPRSQTHEDAVEHGSTSPSSQAQEEAVEHGGEDVTVTVGDLDGGFYIEDDGTGIPPESRDGVFEAGYSTSEEGTGFGLSIVKQIVEAHGWEIRLTESDAGGARFEISGVSSP